MIKHVVMWKLKDEKSKKTKFENAKLIKSRLENLQNIISEIKYIEVGINLENFENNHDVVLISEFESLTALEIYQKHESHLEVSKFVKSITELRTAVDFEF
ncbi:Stress responsive alpha-beta barrel domain protein [Methanococcus vannielii SB]|uniref:Stress responsive alpha-beta barrel domain protein n=1 Tax=Methanococcus vannielii (strain ATCC 35089 / DSM 1224 / JCM 13029 / OCM 148 / SB) TaxID=406327 RepID=A6UN76_METVS|nr:Dabb family protein [Methanococcus vannielii]ABR53948.1 Stress responsive alpha-beta barrel domain protein [Methanococcus vannielii SB]